MTEMDLRTFSVFIALDPSVSEAAMRRYVLGSRMPAVIEPRLGMYFPAAVWCYGALSARHIVHARLRLPVLGGQAALLDDGQAFIFWADAIVGDDTIRGDGLLGHGIVLAQESSVLSGRCELVVPRRPARRPLPECPAVPLPPFALADLAAAGRQ
jgi:hypothetical protein